MSLYDLIWSRYKDPDGFLERVEGAMAEHGISQADLARRSGYDPQEIYKWLRRRRTPSMETMVKLDEALDQLVGA